MKSVMPLTKACFNRSSTVNKRQAVFTTSTLPFAFTVSANFTKFSVASAFLLNMTSSIKVNKSLGISSYTINIPAFTIPMSIPALMAWYKNTECIASRTVSLPLKENEILLTPPLTLANGKLALIH